MEINFSSKVNNLTADNGEHYFKEEEELTWQVSIQPSEGQYKLQMTHGDGSTDRNFLLQEYELREKEASDNTILFEVYHQAKKLGSLHFRLPLQLSYPVSSIVMQFDKLPENPAALLLACKRLSDFVITLDTDEDVAL